ncbi:hypothetical protein X971_3527 [Agrobacterium tumefaciens LBA4213 (Ach5)]|nr:hypothetical protein X971_3527 [Agrobacterium tumefaciens LBA4213 (Ach5)]
MNRRLNFAITPAFLKARSGYLLLREVWGKHHGHCNNRRQ